MALRINVNLPQQLNVRRDPGAYTLKMGKNKRQQKAPGSLLSGLSASVLSSIRGAAPFTEGHTTLTGAGTKRAADPDEQEQAQSRPAKKQKLEGLLGPEWERYDATNVVPFYQKQKDVPEMLKKCELHFKLRPMEAYSV
jgi:trimethylguanosine synthase